MIHLFGDRLKELRKTNNLTQDDIAKMFDVTKNAVYSWEVGKAQPSYDILTKLAEYFKVTTDYLLGFNQDDEDKISKLEIVLKEYGIDDLEKAMQILEILKENKDTK